MRFRSLTPLFLVLSFACVSNGLDGSNAVDDGVVYDRAHDDLSSIKKVAQKKVCDQPAAAGFARCHARVRVDSTGKPWAAKAPNASTPSGFGPADIKSAYAIPGTGTAGTVAIVDAQDDPNAEADLAVYRQQYGLPPCTTANGCFKKVNQSGQSSPMPAADSGWAEEISLDLDMVSAACPQCKIVLVEATSASMDDLGAAVNTAASLGATAISNSYGGSEDSTVTAADSQYFNHPGVLITVSSGDGGYGVEYPASSAHVVAVGGTSLVKSTSNARGWTEGVWNSNGGAPGSGCSAFIAKPSFQKDTGCGKRTVADVAAVADPSTGVAVYDTYGGVISGGWGQFGGTSASSPLVAAILTWTGKAGQPNSFPYSNTSSFYDVVSGTNVLSGSGCGSNKYLCTAQAGYDGPTGVGTPNGAALAAGGGGGGGTNDFSVSASPSALTVAQGSSGSSSISTAVTAGSAQTVSLSVSGAPSGVTATLTPSSVSAGQSATLNISATSSATAGSATLTITGTASSGSHTATVALTVSSSGGGSSSDFTLAVSPASVTVAQGASGTASLTSTAVGDPETVALSSAGAPSGVTVSFDAASVPSGKSATVTVAVGASAPPGSYSITITGSADSGTHSTTLGLTLTAGSGGGGGGGNTCSHPICSTGKRLKASCDSCATEICQVDSYCCTNSWDSICVGEVQSVCGESCGGGGGGGGGGQCTHDVCTTGADLDASCGSCAATICQADSFCCSTSWDSICVAEVPFYCGQSCK